MKVYCHTCQKKHEASGWRGRVVNGEHQWNCDERVKYPEFVPAYILEDRKKHARDLLQPHIGDNPNPEFIREYPVQSAKMFTEKELKKATR